MKDFKKYSKENIHFLHAKLPELLKREIENRNFRSLADIGCGDGPLFHALKQEDIYERIKEKYGIDLSEKRLNRLKSHCPEVKTVQADACDLARIDRKFDLIASSQVIEHVPDDSQMLKEINKIIAPNGTLFISSVVKKPHAWWIYKNNGIVRCDPTHVREYGSDQEFCDLIKCHDYTIKACKMQRFRPSFLNALIRLLIKAKVLPENTISKLAQKQWYAKLSNLLKIPAPGYFTIEVIATKNPSPPES